MQLKRNLLSVALASATLVLAGQAVAQEQPAEPASAEQEAKDLDAVVVTGIRRSIEDAIDTKQSADTIVESISAEDIGKLPDMSIADSIARLPGLTAQRVNGRAQDINIRGLSGDFANTLLNGREQVSMGNNRGVEFDQYPSELLGSVTVHKTTDATLVGQGLSGTVNLKTVRPLSFNERVIAANYRRDLNETEDQKAYGERYSLTYIDQFADNTFGLAMGYAHLNNPGQDNQFGAWGYYASADDGNGGTAAQIGGADIFAFDRTNERDGFFATLEWKPADGFTSTLDLFYSKFDRSELKQGVQFSLGNGTATSVSGNGTAIAGTAPVNQAVIRNDYSVYKDELFSLGWRNELELGTNWTMTTDVSHSSGNREQPILETYAVRNEDLDDTVAYTFNEDGYYDLDFGLDYTDPNIFTLMDPGGWGGDRAQAGFLKTFQTDDRLTSTRIDLQRRFDDGFISSIEFGVNYADRSKSRGSNEFTLCLTPGCTDNTGAPIPTSLVENQAFGFFGIDSLLTMDPLRLLNEVYIPLQKDNIDISRKNWSVDEQIGTLYVQANLDADLGSVPLRGNVGVQFMDVEQSSTGFQTYEGGSAVGNQVTDGANYTHVLPSMNLSFQFPADQFLRVGASKQVARPRMDDMAVNSNITIDRTTFLDADGDPIPTWRQSGGNPQLEPWEANAYDVSYEKYFGGNKGYVSAAYFYKDLKTYIYDEIGTFDIRDTSVPYQLYPDVPSPIGVATLKRNGDGGTIEGYELAASVPFDIMWAPLEGFGIVASYSDTRTSVQPRGPDFPDEPLPGFSKYVSNVTLYFERWGFSARASRRTRSPFVGEIQGDGAVGGNRTLVSYGKEEVVDLQLGYTLQSGPAEGLGFLFQVNNLTDEPATRFSEFTDRPTNYTAYGRNYLLGVSYRF